MIQTIERWRKDRQRQKTARKLMCWLSSGSISRVYSLVTSAPDWMVERYVGGRLGKGVLALLRLYSAPPFPGPKELLVNLRAAKSLWNSRLSVRIHMKW